MKIAISAHQPHLDGEIDPRFGRCRYFVLVDPQTMDSTGVENPNATLEGGAGIGTAQFVVQQGAQLIITGTLGPKALQALSAAGIQMITGAKGKIRQVIEDYNSGRLQADSGTPASAERAQPRGTAPGAGMGRGRGGGGGCGRGMGMGKGRCWEPRSQATPAVGRDFPGAARSEEVKYHEISGKETLDELRERVSMLNEALFKVQQRIHEMEQQQPGF